MNKNKLRVVMLSGDWIPLNMPNKIKNNFNNTQVISLGGATEASIWSIYHPVKEVKSDWNSIPYGKPLANQKFYVLNSEMQLCPVGVQGELYIGGAGVAEGYINDEEKTNNSFIHHPEFGYIYKTGDYGILHKNGEIEFLGRKDHQVKIRGYRIEMGEIESCLLEHPGIKNAIVIDRIDPNGRKYLCAYLVSPEKITVSELREFLLKDLPDYMVPSYFIYLDELPLTQNGKIDRKKLPEPEGNINTGEVFKEAEDPVEKWLVLLWKDILDVEKVGINDNFFELGGDSLFAGRLITEIHKKYNVEIPINIMFESPTIKAISDFIKENHPKSDIILPENLVLINKNPESRGNLFLIHAAMGEVEIYLDLCNHSMKDITYWGIRKDRLETYSPVNISNEEIAARYLGMIKAVQPEGPYSIAGWCAGGTVAFEIARQLEEKKEKVQFLALINSMAPQQGLVNDERPFSVETEIDMLKHYAESGIDILEITGQNNENITGIEDFWEKFFNYIEKPQFSIELVRKFVPKHIIKLMPKFEQLNKREIFSAVNLIRTSMRTRALYFPPNKINAPVFFFEATQERFENRDNWNLYCENPIKLYEIEGDHVTIFFSPFVEAFAELLKQCFFSVIE